MAGGRNELPVWHNMAVRLGFGVWQRRGNYAHGMSFGPVEHRAAGAEAAHGLAFESERMRLTPDQLHGAQRTVR